MGDRFKGKVVLVAGAGAGMGRTAALRYAGEGASIVACSTDPVAGAETKRAVEEAGGRIECLYPLDLTQESEVKRLMAHAKEKFGGIDVLYINAHRLKLGLPGKMTMEGFEFTLRYTLTLHWLVAKHAIPLMAGRSGASMVLISSAAAHENGTGFVGNWGGNFAYGIAKAGVNRLVVLLAIELAPLGIRVNGITSGMIDSKDGNLISDFCDDWTRQMLVPRPGISDEIVKPAMFLTSADAAFMTGQNITIDGGWIASLGQGQPDPDICARIEKNFTDAFGDAAFAHDAEV